MEPLRLAVNGYGRIGRCFVRALQARSLGQRLSLRLINEPAAAESIAYLTRFDSTHGRFAGSVVLREEQLWIDGCPIALQHEQTPEAVDWRAMGIDLVLECSGAYGQRRELARFLQAGCPRVLLSHPAQSAADVDATLVYGFNHQSLSAEARLVSNASCTTHAAVPVLSILQQMLDIEQVQLTTLHSVMNDQPLVDSYHHADLRRTRSALQSMIPVSTALARGVERLLPQLQGRIQAKAIRVPTANVSAIDMVLTSARPVTAAQVNRCLADAVAGQWHGLIDFTDTPHASVDFNHDPHSAIIDGSQTQVSAQHLVNVWLWFDNEWAFAHRMLDVALYWQEVLAQSAGGSASITPPAFSGDSQ